MRLTAHLTQVQAFLLRVPHRLKSGRLADGVGATSETHFLWLPQRVTGRTGAVAVHGVSNAVIHLAMIATLLEWSSDAG